MSEPASANGQSPWLEFLGDVLDRREVQRLLDLKTREAVGDLVADGRLLALPATDGDLVFPAFQFWPNRSLNPTIVRVLTILGPVVVTPFTIVSWLRSPKEQLGGKTPVEWLSEGRPPEPVIEAAELSAARLAV